MALPILDGNQSATTLSSVVTGGEHIVAHSVVSLGTTAIANITSAVSGSVVSISNFPSTQTIAGTVTANLVGWDGGNLENVRIGGYSVGEGNAGRLALEVIGVDGNPLSISGTVTANLKSDVYDGANDWDLNRVALHAYMGGDEWQAVGSGNIALPISGTVTVANFSSSFIIQDAQNNQAAVNEGTGALFVEQVGSVTIGSLPAISGTVTANVDQVSLTNALDYFAVNYSEAFPVSLQSEISGTVTAAAPNGSLTTRFGTPTTANVSFATSAVTNANRKYLLIQNVTTGSNVITVGIGFTPTTTQGIQLTAGAGITFESSYIPTGAVQILSSVTASNFTILEA